LVWNWDCYLFGIAQKGNAKKASAVFLSLRFTSEISTTSVIIGVLPRGARISGCFTCVKKKAQHDNRQTQDVRI
jgi:hypothetical protein